jgi:hypothetical protein
MAFMPGLTTNILPSLKHIQPPFGNWCANKPPWGGDSFLTAAGQPNGQDYRIDTSFVISIPYQINYGVRNGRWRILICSGPISENCGTPVMAKYMVSIRQQGLKQDGKRHTANSMHYIDSEKTCDTATKIFSIPLQTYTLQHNQYGQSRTGSRFKSLWRNIVPKKQQNRPYATSARFYLTSAVTTSLLTHNR